MIEYRTSLSDVRAEQLNGFCAGWKSPLSSEQPLFNSAYVVLAIQTEDC